jgi:hypothetical protein
MLICDSSQLLRTNSGKERRLYFSANNATDTTKQQAALSFDRRESVCSVTSDTDNNVEMQVAINLDKSVNNILTNQDFFPSGHKLRESASLPASPLRRLDNPDSPTHKFREEVMKSKCKHHSPIFKRKSKYPRQHDITAESLATALKENNQSYSYKNLESFQKSQLKQKVSILL